MVLLIIASLVAMKSPTADNDTAIDAEMDTATAREETSEAQDSVAAEMVGGAMVMWVLPCAGAQSC